MRNEKKNIKRTKSIVVKVKAKKLKLFLHVCRMGDNRVLKTVMLGREDGMRKKGRQGRRWLNDIKEWTGLNIQQAVH